jgi:hypothetical protein
MKYIDQRIALAELSGEWKDISMEKRFQGGGFSMELKEEIPSPSGKFRSLQTYSQIPDYDLDEMFHLETGLDSVLYSRYVELLEQISPIRTYSATSSQRRKAFLILFNKWTA